MINSDKYIPVEWYTNEPLFKTEIESVFNQDVPTYYAHESSVVNPGDFYSIPADNYGKAIIRDEHGLYVISNICRHRQSLLMSGRGNQKSILCPVHFWKYNNDGTLANSPQIEKNDCLNLEKFDLFSWNGLVLKRTSNIDRILSAVNSLGILSKNNYSYGSHEVMEANYNWKIFMETYLDLYHIGPLHPGLRKFADCSDVDWEMGDGFSSQIVGVKLLDNGENPSPFYSRLAELIKLLPDHNEAENKKIIWFALYPNIMIEVYPYNLVVSIVIPKSPDKTLNVVEFLYDSRLNEYEFGKELHENFKRAYLETATEDDKACLDIHSGRKILSNMSKEEHGPFHPSLEVGIPHFYDFWKESVKA